jgi:hypothetical protein
MMNGLSRPASKRIWPLFALTTSDVSNYSTEAIPQLNVESKDANSWTVKHELNPRNEQTTSGAVAAVHALTHDSLYFTYK